MLFSSVCQQFNVLGEHPLRHLAWHGVRMNCGIRTQLKRRFWSSDSGAPSRFAQGDWVRVLDRERIQATLDPAARTRGLLFLDYQWPYCSGAFRVQKVMTRIIDDDGIFRAVSRTVLLEGVNCGGVDGSHGCGRECPLMFRDEWLEPAGAPAGAGARTAGSLVRVRSLEGIRASLDWRGKRDGLMFMPEMAQWTGGLFRVLKKVESIYECGRHTRARAPIYILEGLHCSGGVLDSKGPCDRRCSVLWHADWLADAG